VFTRQKLLNLVTLVSHYKNELTINASFVPRIKLNSLTSPLQIGDLAVRAVKRWDKTQKTAKHSSQGDK
jgi:hypothetical protein